MSAPDDKAKAQAFGMIIASAKEDAYVEELSKKTDEELMAMVGERGKAFLEKSRQMLRDSQKAAAFRAIVEQAEEDDLEKKLEGKKVDELPPRAQAALERGRKMLREMPVAEDKKVVRAESRFRRLTQQGGAAALAFAAAIVLMIGLSRTDNLPRDFYPVRPIPTAAGNLSPADIERGQAYEAYLQGDYDACLMHLDRAKAIDTDPHNDSSDVVQRARRLCKKHVAPHE